MKFVVVGLPKTGKTMICDSLDKLDGFTVYDEIFTARMGHGKAPDHPLKFMNDMRKRKKKNCFVKWYQKHHNTDVMNIKKLAEPKDIEGFLDHTFSKDENVGFKLHHHHIITLRYILRYLRDNNIKIIHTYRRNKLKQAIAVLGNRKRITINKEKFKLKLNSIEKKIKEFETRNIQLIEWFDNNNYDYMKIVYEDLTGDKHINEMDVREIKEFLGVDIPDVIPVRTKKNTFTKVKDNLINYKEILDGISTD
jgi:hypothetical protein